MTATQTRPVWERTASQHQASIGVHQPYLAEISPWQYSSMGKQAKRQYDAKRAREWDASSAAKQGWARLVIEAYERGDFTLDDPAVSSEARTAIFWHKERCEKAAHEAKILAATRANRITEATDLHVGDRVYTVMGGFYTTITKVNRKSVRIESRYKGDPRPRWPGDTKGYDQSDYTTAKGNLQWLSRDDLEASVKNAASTDEEAMTA